MKKILIIPIVFSFLLPQAFAQIKFPNLLGGIKESFTKPQSIMWNCPVPDGNGVEVLPAERELKISAKGKGDVSIKPNIFGTRLFSKDFFKRTFNKITKKDNLRHVYDYEGCLSDLYKKVEDSFDKETAERLKNTIAKSDYFKEDKNKVVVPLYSTVPELLITQKEVDAALDKFCADPNSAFNDVLKSKKVASIILTESQRYQHEPKYSYNCLRSLNEKLAKDHEDYLKKVCDLASDSICGSFKADLESNRQALANAADQYEKHVLATEERRFKNLVREEVHTKFKNIITNKNLTCDELKEVGFYQINHIDYDVMINENLENIENMEGDNACLATIMQNYLASRQFTVRNDSDYEKFCNKNLTPKCIQNRKDRAVIVENYKAMFVKIYGARGERHFEQDIACRIIDENPLAGLLQGLEENKSVLHCLDVKPGEFRVVRAYDNPKAQSGNYTLKRVDDKNYDVILNLNFTSTSGASVTPEEMRTRVNECVGDVNQFLKGPGGEQLNLKILDTNNIKGIPKNQVPHPTAINIEKAGFRSHSRAYEETISCAVITHELLHLFGLCDEYEEKWNPQAHNYACRVVPNTASIMKDHNEAFRRGVGRVNQCECTADNCKKIMAGSDEELKDMLLQASIYDITDYEFRTEYCQPQTQGPKVDYSNMSIEDRVGVKVVDSTEGFLKIESRYIGESYPRVETYSMTCRCPAGDESCQGRMDKVKGSVDNSRGFYASGCPNGSRLIDSKIGSLPESKPSSLKNNKFSFARKPEWDSLLHPAHGQRILGGTCETEGADYLQCMIYAYQRKPKSECNVPEKCKDDSYYLGIKK